jgi:predicted phosphodiesterase
MVTGERLFTFAVIADSHVTEAEATAIGGYDINTVKLGAGRSRRVVHELNRLAPDFTIHLGDITHPEPGSPAYEDSAERFHTVYDELDCPLHLVAGNHDIGEKAFPGEPLTMQQARRTVNDEMIAVYEQHFQAQYYSFDHEDCLFVVMNGMIVNSGLAREDEQRVWLEALLADNDGRRIFMFSHYPPYLSRADEPGHYDATDEPGRSWLLGLLEGHRVEAYYAGHVHNFFFNRHGATSCYVLPSICFLRHDYHELFRAAPGEGQGRHDAAKLGYAVVDVHAKGHLNHAVRTYGRTLEAGEALPAEPASLSPVHGLSADGIRVGLYLRQPWCDSADIPTPWGLDAFSRKRIRNDYPLMALWEMGVRDLRVPLDDLADGETRARMAELAGLGHRFTAYSYGLPRGAGAAALGAHGDILTAWEVIAPITSASELLVGIAALKGAPAVYFNPCRVDVEAFSSSHGLEPDGRGAVEALLALDGAQSTIDGIVFGVGWRESPAWAVAAARRSVEGLGVKAAVHVQFAHRKPLGREETDRHDANRIAEAVTAALAWADVGVVLDNFTGIDRGYYFSGGLVDRLYNPLDGARIVRHLHAALGEGCSIDSIDDDESGRILTLGEPHGAGALILPARPIEADAGMDHWIDLASGTHDPATLTGPTLVLPGGRNG